MKRKFVVWLGLTVIVIWAAALTLPDNRLHVIFCNVGQGDATLLVWGRIQILVDGGPDASVVNCLAGHVPFYDKRIDLIVLTHPHEDHFGGLISVLQRYSVTYFVKGKVDGTSEKYRDFLALALEKDIKLESVSVGDKLKLVKGKAQLEIDTLWPEGDMAASDLNLKSLVQLVRFSEFELLLTGDADAEVWKGRMGAAFGSLEVVKVPHHGSRTALDEEWLQAVKPKLAVISVGKNSYGHPADLTLKQLATLGVEVRRTDKGGEVEVVSDGQRWWVK
jgi:competence protein ComEC